MTQYNFWDNLMETDENAGEYMKSYGEGPGAQTRVTLGQFINDGETVLDAGCGPGHNFDHFLEFGPSISAYKGLDYAIRFVRAANLRHPGHYEQGDVRDLQELNNSWDVVIMQDVLEHTNGYEGPIREALRVAKKRVILTFWHLTENDDHINDDGNDGWGAWYSKPRLEEFLDSLNVHWLHHQLDDGKKMRDYYILDKEVPHGSPRG